MTEVLIIGGGLAGLSAAQVFHKKNISYQLLEADTRVGGRIKTDLVDGYRLDRGFQVLLTAYPETKKYLDYEALNLKSFYPGAVILQEKGKTEIGDPLRKPSSLLKTVFANVGNIQDKVNILRLRLQLGQASLEEIFGREEISTLEALKAYGFSNQMIEQFFKPFMGGIFLESDLTTSRRMFDFVFKMFSSGDTSVPALGMEEIPKQMLQKLNPQNIHLEKEVQFIEKGRVICKGGAEYQAKRILIATEATGLVQQYAPKTKTDAHAVTCVYFYADKAPLSKPILILDARPESLVNNVAVMSQVSPDYAPKGKVLISVSINGLPKHSTEELSALIKQTLFPSLGDSVLGWRPLKSYPIRYALPNQTQVNGKIEAEKIKLREDLYQTGDFLLNGSINAAMQAGRESAEIIASSL